jgi:flagellar biosynthesis anti-sigma factor FlgM
MKINELRQVIEPSAYDKAGTVGDRAPVAKSDGSPSVSLELSDAVRQALLTSAHPAAESFDAELVQAIREKVQNGTFVIDFDKVAEGLLQNAVSQAKRNIV